MNCAATSTASAAQRRRSVVEEMIWVTTRFPSKSFVVSIIYHTDGVTRYTLFEMNATDLQKLQRPGLCLPRELVASPIYLLARLGIAVKLQVMEEFEKEGLT